MRNLEIGITAKKLDKAGFLLDLFRNPWYNVKCRIINSKNEYDNEATTVENQVVSFSTTEAQKNGNISTLKLNSKVIEPRTLETKDEYIDYILNGDKQFVFEQAELDVSTLLSEASSVTMLSNGNVTGTFKSKKMETGTPFVKWSYSIDYEIEPYSNGSGWRFVDVQGTVYIHKSILLYTWATSCVVTFEEAYHSLNSGKTAVTIDIRLRFDVTTEAIAGVVTYYEDHSHTTAISNVAS